MSRVQEVIEKTPEVPFWQVSYDSEKLKKLIAQNKYHGVKSLKIARNNKHATVKI